MTFPLIFLTDGCCGFFPEKAKTKSDKAKIVTVFASAIFDILGTITLLVIGILGATKVLSLPPAGAYTMIGVAGLSVVLWAIMLVKGNC